MIVFDMDGVLVEVTESYRETIVPDRPPLHRPDRRPRPDPGLQEPAAAGTTTGMLSQKICRDLGVEVEYDDRRRRLQRVLSSATNGNDGLMQREVWIARRACSNGSRALPVRHLHRAPARRSADDASTASPPLQVFDPIITDRRRHPRQARIPKGLLNIAASIRRQRIYYVGDTVDDARSGRAARVPFIGIAARATIAPPRTGRPDPRSRRRHRHHRKHQRTGGVLPKQGEPPPSNASPRRPRSAAR